MKKCFIRQSLALSLALLTLFSARAEYKKIEEPDTSAFELNTIEVEGRRQRSDLSSSVARHSVGAADFNRRGIHDIAGAVKNLPGVNLRDYGGAGGMKIVSVRGLGSQHTGVLYDGVPLSDIQSGQVDLSRYTLDDVKGVSVAVGENQDIFIPARAGSSAASLMINTGGNAMKFDPGWMLVASVKGGGYGFISPYLKVGYGNGRNWSIAVNGEYTHADNNYPYTIKSGDYSSKQKRTNSDINSGHGEINYKWRPAPGHNLQAKGYFFDSFRHLPGPAILYNTDASQSLWESNLFAQCDYKGRLSSKFSISALAKFNWSRTRYLDVSGIYQGGVDDNRYIQREEYLSAGLLYTPLPGLNAAYAIDWFRNDLSTYGNVDVPNRNSILQSLAVKYSVWRLTVNAKALLSVYIDASDNGAPRSRHSRLSPSVSLSVKPLAGSDFYIRAGYKGIFRMPSFNELYFKHYGTVKLEPENTDQINVGIGWHLPAQPWLTGFTVTVDGFWNQVTNKISAVPYNMFVWTMTNIGKVRGLGADISLEAGFPVARKQEIKASGNLTVQDVRTRTSREMIDWNKQLAYTPTVSGAFSVAWENPWLSLGINGSGSGMRWATNNNIEGTDLPGYMEFGATAWHEFNFHGHQLEIRADLLNAFNKQYEIITRYPMPGRSWQVSLKFTL